MHIDKVSKIEESLNFFMEKVKQKIPDSEKNR